MAFRVRLRPLENARYRDVMSGQVFTPDECQCVRSLVSEDGWDPAGLIDYAGDRGGYHNDKVRSALVQTLPFDSTWPLVKLTEAIAEYNGAGPRVDAESFVKDDPPAVVRYRGGTQDHFRPHQDVGPSQSTRKLTFVLQLSSRDEYRGGDLVFPELGQTASVEQGVLVVFPSFLQHLVTPVLAGERYALIGWVHGRAFR